ncbi:hypothetical protein Bca52824_049208 [Brassica carinata]|uniref:Uncharacterized protein n=1 Tax=Brassica carinata TaxID=52824 RepID=A0A8X7USW6_BRACI|nr:hypothetical protein Bca52824_049208 [Brassica carinata]
MNASTYFYYYDKEKEIECTEVKCILFFSRFPMGVGVLGGVSQEEVFRAVPLLYMSLGFNGCTWSQVGELEAAIFSTLRNGDIVDSDILFVVADPSSPLFPLVCFICPSFLRVLFSLWQGELHLSSDPESGFQI